MDSGEQMAACRTSTVRLLSRGKFPWLVPGCTRASDDGRPPRFLYSECRYVNRRLAMAKTAGTPRRGPSIARAWAMLSRGRWAVDNATRADSVVVARAVGGGRRSSRGWRATRQGQAKRLDNQPALLWRLIESSSGRWLAEEEM